MCIRDRFPVWCSIFRRRFHPTPRTPGFPPAKRPAPSKRPEPPLCFSSSSVSFSTFLLLLSKYEHTHKMAQSHCKISPYFCQQEEKYSLFLIISDSTFYQNISIERITFLADLLVEFIKKYIIFFFGWEGPRRPHSVPGLPALLGLSLIHIWYLANFFMPSFHLICISLWFYHISTGSTIVFLVLLFSPSFQMIWVLSSVSYTHLDVYKRQ